MKTKLFGGLTGWQITAIVCTALLAPSAIFAAATYSNVSVINPATGVPVTIDAVGRMLTYDAIALYRNYPVQYVDIRIPMNNADGCEPDSFTISDRESADHHLDQGQLFQ